MALAHRAGDLRLHSNRLEMRHVRFWAAVLSLIALQLNICVRAQTQSLPQCSSECLTRLLPQSPCSADDQVCICTNHDLNTKLESCVAANCTVKESLTTLKVTNTECGAPIRDQTSLSIILPAVGFGALIFVALRIYTRLFVTQPGMGLDDWATILLACCTIPVNSGSILLGIAGLGKDIWTLEFDKITRILYLFYIQEIIYIFCIALTKICLLLFYLRIFPSKRMRLIIQVSSALTFCYCITFMFALAFQCSPVSYNWNGWDGEHEGSCVKKNALVITAAALNVVLDFWVIALPIPGVLRLQASIVTKLQVIFMFTVGFLITGVSIYRTIMLKIFATSTNATWDQAAGGYWSIIEVDVGLFCICLPALRSLLGHLMPSVFGSTKGASSAGQPLSSLSNSQHRPRLSKVGRSDANASFMQLIEMDATGNLKSHG
ncbi:integral membrane protein [Aspergillus granulosus]|uniref:Integral membrane protein n=1 Tax=Aspergillus granulosus TaxID=176169 RepID=A0ABR4GZ54_9EURO